MRHVKGDRSKSSLIASASLKLAFETSPSFIIIIIIITYCYFFEVVDLDVKKFTQKRTAFHVRSESIFIQNFGHMTIFKKCLEKT